MGIVFISRLCYKIFPLSSIYFLTQKSISEKVLSKNQFQISSICSYFQSFSINFSISSLHQIRRDLLLLRQMWCLDIESSHCEWMIHNEDELKDEKNPRPLDEDDIALLKTYVISQFLCFSFTDLIFCNNRLMFHSHLLYCMLYNIEFQLCFKPFSVHWKIWWFWI